MRLLFVLGSPEYLRYYDSTLDELAGRGHEVAVAVNSRREKKPVGLERLQSLEGSVEVVGVAPTPSGRWSEIARGLRGVMDFVRYLHPRLAEATALRRRMKYKSTPVAFRCLDVIPRVPPRALQRIVSALAALERAIPVDPAVVQFLRDRRPDALLVSPLVDAASEQVEFIKAAQALGIPSAACIASWDNLTNKGLLRIIPDRVIVWNEAQRREAGEYHYVTPDRITVTGAQLFDRWFTMAMTRGRSEFCRRVGLSDDRPFVLFTGSSSFISESNAELAFVRRWVAMLRQSSDARLRDINVLVRPHPYNCHAWKRPDVCEPGMAVYPAHGYSPIASDSRADFYDSIFHSAAVVGINTSAMIEAAIVGRPVLSIHAPEFARTQEGTLHFHHLLPENGGFLRVASTLEEHAAQLADRLRHPEHAREETARFITSFVRPHGLDRTATPIAADAVEQVARLGPQPVAPMPAWAMWVRPIILLLAAYAGLIRWWTRPDRNARVKKRLKFALFRAHKFTSRTIRIALSRVRRQLRAYGRQIRRLRVAMKGSR